MAANYRLVLNSGPTPGKEFTLEKPEVFLGRDIGNDFVINDPEVSRRHARIYLQGNMYIIEDLGSTNGTTVNGQKLTGPYMLRAGEQITFGEHVNLSYQAVTSPAEISSGVQPLSPVPAAGNLITARPANQAPVSPQQPEYNQPGTQTAGSPQQQVPPYQPSYQQSSAYPLQQANQPQPSFPARENLPQGQYSGQVPAPAYPEEPLIQYRIPIWLFVLIGVLLITIVVLLIDDFHLWCPLFGIC